jgi:hypothetical protein
MSTGGNKRVIFTANPQKVNRPGSFWETPETYFYILKGRN